MQDKFVTLSASTVYQRSVGFDKTVDQMSKIADQVQRGQKTSYPPYNIWRTEYGYEIQVAVAGWDKEEIELISEKSILTLKGQTSHDEGSSDRELLYRGVSQKDFTLQWELADSVKVRSCDFSEGMLFILLDKLIPEEDQPQKIEIN